MGIAAKCAPGGNEARDRAFWRNDARAKSYAHPACAPPSSIKLRNSRPRRPTMALAVFRDVPMIPLCVGRQVPVVRVATCGQG